MASFAGRSRNYIFEDAGGMREQLEQAVLNELQRTKYPLPTRVQKVKAGGLFGSKEQCVVVDLMDSYQICISNTTVGTYLYVGIYLMVPRPILSDAGSGAYWASQIGDVFKLQRIDAHYGAAVAATESAFVQLALKQTNSGYHSQ